MVKLRPFGEKPSETPPPKPWWATLGFWSLMGAFAGLCVFVYSERAMLHRAMPDKSQMVKVGRELQQIAVEFAEEYVPEGAEEEVAGPSAESLSAPQGAPVRRAAKKQRRQVNQVDIRDKRFKNSGEAVEYRQHMDAPWLESTFKIPFLSTALGRGMFICISMTCGFALFGYILFRTKKPRY